MGSAVLEATRETFPDLVADGTVLVDVWGPQCRPCLALAPAVERMAEERGVPLVKLEAPKNRRLCIDLKVMSLPAFLLYRDGQEVSRLGGQDLTAERIEAWLDQAMNGEGG